MKKALKLIDYFVEKIPYTALEICWLTFMALENISSLFDVRFTICALFGPAVSSIHMFS
jgi:hypothetical protein